MAVAVQLLEQANLLTDGDRPGPPRHQLHSRARTHQDGGPHFRSRVRKTSCESEEEARASAEAEAAKEFVRLAQEHEPSRFSAPWPHSFLFADSDRTGHGHLRWTVPVITIAMTKPPIA